MRSVSQGIKNVNVVIANVVRQQQQEQRRRQNFSDVVVETPFQQSSKSFRRGLGDAALPRSPRDERNMTRHEACRNFGGALCIIAPQTGQVTPGRV